jgi:D-lactate dehydrogenase
VRASNPGLVEDLGRLLGRERVLARAIDRIGRSADASIYRLIPQAIVRPRDLGDVRALFDYARRRGRRLTFRTAGTSLSGQAMSDDLLVELGPSFRAFRILDGGRRVWSQPGVIGGHLNRLLAPLGYRIGPDPASIDAAMLGGILANNSSGMCCGVAQNSYHTLDAMNVLLADGASVDTARGDADARFCRERPALHAGLARLRDDVRANAALCAKIQAKFARKNTTGYSLNAFLDYKAPSDILTHLMIGSEGTLGFIADATLRTLPELGARATALVLFERLAEAGAAVAPLADAGAAALEILDSSALRSIAAELPASAAAAIDQHSAALLTELALSDEAGLVAAISRAERAVACFRLLAPVRFTRDVRERATLWRLRKGLAATTGALRPSGTAFLTEDVAVPVERLAEAIADCQQLFVRAGAPETILFGHAKDGNLHFVWAEDLREPEAVARYGRFMQALVDLVVGKYDGALKAEHGSGRNMAPFVRTEWGDDAYEVMRRVKRLLDPTGILNPGVVLNDDPEVHLKQLKAMPAISPLADRCIECGLCEPRCPSRELTLTPRQRIVVTRERARLGGLGDAESRGLDDALAADFAYAGLATCVGDGMCESSCPVKIDTGALMKEMKAAGHSRAAHAAAAFAADHFGAALATARLGLRASAPLLGLQAAGPLPEPSAASLADRVVYFPSCLTRMIGPAEGDVPLARAMHDVLAAAGFGVAHPDGVSDLCCGLAFANKAFPEAARRAAERSFEALWAASRDGRDPIVTDASPCAEALAEFARAEQTRDGRALHIFDFPGFWAREALPRLAPVARREATVILHPTCSLVKAGGLADLLLVAETYAASVVVPPSAECCGFAGDRGLVLPEVTTSALAREAEEVRAVAAAGHYSTCRTCEIGLTRATGRPYRSLVHFVREALGRG